MPADGLVVMGGKHIFTGTESGSGQTAFVMVGTIGAAGVDKCSTQGAAAKVKAG